MLIDAFAVYCRFFDLGSLIALEPQTLFEIRRLVSKQIFVYEIHSLRFDSIHMAAAETSEPCTESQTHDMIHGFYLE